MNFSIVCKHNNYAHLHHYAFRNIYCSHSAMHTYSYSTSHSNLLFSPIRDFPANNIILIATNGKRKKWQKGKIKLSTIEINARNLCYCRGICFWIWLFVASTFTSVLFVYAYKFDLKDLYHVLSDVVRITVSNQLNLVKWWRQIRLRSVKIISIFQMINVCWRRTKVNRRSIYTYITKTIHLYAMHRLLFKVREQKQWHRFFVLVVGVVILVVAVLLSSFQFQLSK